MKTRLRDLGDVRVIKIRVQNSHQNLSSADGFRLIICCNRKYRTVAFLNVYAKRGKLGQLDQSKEEYKQQLRDYSICFKSKTFIKHNIHQELEEISNQQ
jgi:hypothetical protein